MWETGSGGGGGRGGGGRGREGVVGEDGGVKGESERVFRLCVHVCVSVCVEGGVRPCDILPSKTSGF